MSDLSRLLDDVYEPAVKDNEKGWTSDEALDEAFSGWVPGPSQEASEKERSLFADAPATTTDESPAPSVDSVLPVPPTEWIESAPEGAPTVSTDTDGIVLDEAAPADGWGIPGEQPEVELPVPVATTWQPEDDDILPKRGSSSRLLSFNVSLRR
jgi:hypothetical protein